MTQISDDNLLYYNQLGLFPGPDEAESEFLRRVEYCLDIQKHLDEQHGALIPSDVLANHDTDITEKAWQKTRQLYDMAPTWTPLFFSNYKLMPWHGGCAWIFKITNDSPTSALFQLREAFKKKANYFGLYKRDEILAHEAVHVARMAFEEPKFEEILAYRTSENRFHRFFGPIVQSSGESALFVFVLMSIFFLAFLGFSWGYIPQFVSWLLLIPFAMLAYAVGRLFWRQRQFDRCSSVIQEATNHNALPVMCRLTDNEIAAISNLNAKELMEMASKKSKESLRWKLIAKAYFNVNN